MEGLGSLLLFAVFIYLMMRYGCGSHMLSGRGGRRRDRDSSEKEGSTVKHVDPVCDMEVDVEQGYGKMYKGTLYRFCSRSCLDKFDAEPERYISVEKHSRSQQNG